MKNHNIVPHHSEALISNYETLQSMVAEGSVQLVMLEAIPRSISTAAARALSQGDGVYVNEPFHRLKFDLDGGCGHLVSAAQKHLRSGAEDGVTIVTKNMARNLTHEMFERMRTLSIGVGWIIRDPGSQIASLLTRTANDLTSGDGSSATEQAALTPAQIQAASDFLRHSPESVDYSRTGWQAIGAHYDAYGGSEAVVIDGDRLTSNPRSVLVAACGRLGLTYCDTMVGGWKGGIINANIGPSRTVSDSKHAWTNVAVTSSGIVRAERPPLPWSHIPPELQQHITEVAQPIYERMVVNCAA